MTRAPADRVATVTTVVLLAAAGVLLGVIGAFLVPLRLGSGIEGLSVLIAVVGNLGVGLLGGLGTRSTAGIVAPGLGWFVAVGALFTTGPGGDIVIPGRLGSDPGVPKVGIGFLVGGVLALIVAFVVTTRFTRRASTPTPAQ